MTRAEIARLIKDSVGKYWVKKFYGVHEEFTLQKRRGMRADLLALNCKGHIVIVECKSCLADFKTDTKWHLYQQYCNKFYFAVGAKTYDKIKTLVPPGIGVFVVSPDGSTKIVRPAKEQQLQTPLLPLVLRLAYRSADQSLYQNRQNRRKKRARV